MKNGPPPIESIIADASDRTDTGYALRVHLHGLHGTWHRLWAMLVLESATDGAAADDEGLSSIKEQLAVALGREISADEMRQLRVHAADFASHNPVFKGL